MRSYLIPYLDPKKNDEKEDPVLDEFTYGNTGEYGRRIAKFVEKGDYLFFRTNIHGKDCITAYFNVEKVCSIEEAKKDKKIMKKYNNHHLSLSKTNEENETIVFGNRASSKELTHPMPITKEILDRFSTSAKHLGRPWKRLDNSDINFLLKEIEEFKSDIHTNPINAAINFVIEEVEKPALNEPKLEKKFIGKVARAKTIVERMKKTGDLYRYLKKFEFIPPIGDSNRELYDRFKELNLKTSEDLYPEFVEKFKDHIDDVTVLDDFIIGEEYTSWDVSIFAKTYDTQSGIYLIGDEPNYRAVFVKATFKEGKYPNEWIESDQKLKYYMYSNKGQFKKDYKYNQAILNSIETKTPIYVFQKEGTRLLLKGIYKYDSDHENSADGSRYFILKKINTLNTDQIMTEKEYENETHKRVKGAQSSSSKDRDNRLKAAAKIPGKVTTTSTQYKRNPDVIAEVLERANGICEKCDKPAPFLRRDLTPFLEVHHEVPLSEEGEDTVENAVAICPNCHREYHYAADKVITVSISLIIENEKMLILRKNIDNDTEVKWNVPGAVIEKGDPPKESLQSEIYKALGVNLESHKYYDQKVYESSSGIIRYLIYKVKGNENIYKINQNVEIKLVDIKELKNVEISNEFIPLIKNILNEETLLN